MRLNPGSATPLCHLEQANDLSGLGLFTWKVNVTVFIAEG